MANLQPGDVVECTRLSATRIDHSQKPVGVVLHVYTKAAEVVWPGQTVDRYREADHSIEWLTDLRRLDNG